MSDFDFFESNVLKNFFWEFHTGIILSFFPTPCRSSPRSPTHPTMWSALTQLMELNKICWNFLESNLIQLSLIDLLTFIDWFAHLLTKLCISSVTAENFSSFFPSFLSFSFFPSLFPSYPPFLFLLSPYPSPLSFFPFHMALAIFPWGRISFWPGTHYVKQGSLELLPLRLKCWDFRYVPRCLVFICLFACFNSCFLWGQKCRVFVRAFASLKHGPLWSNS